MQTREGGELGSVVGYGKRRLDAGQVGIGYAAHTQQLELGFGGAHARGCVHHRLHRISQGLQFGHGVDGCPIGGDAVAVGCVEDIAQQAFLLKGVHAAHAQGGVLRLRGVDAVVVGHTVCALQDSGVGVDDGLQ